VRARRVTGASLQLRIATTLIVIYEYSDSHPGVMRAAMTDEQIIDTEGVEVQPLLVQWGMEWAEMVRDFARERSACGSYNAEIIGQAIFGALYQASRESHRSVRSREVLVKNLTAFPTRALKPDV
jgi:hypothetical protein